MKISLAADHRGFRTKETAKAFLQELGHEILDFGTNSRESCDYPDYVYPAAKAVAQGKAEYGIFACSHGIGTSMTANKVKGIRAALCCDTLSTDMARRHNNTNVLCLPADMLTDIQVTEIIQVFVTTGFDGNWHQQRLDKVARIENSWK